MIAAVENGADSVYWGVKGMTMRNEAGNFDLLEIKKVMDYLHRNKKKGYCALNTIMMNNENGRVKKILQESRAAGADAVILWDMGVFVLARELGLPVHLSTQASVSNASALRFFAQSGVRRVILARECTIEDIKEIGRFLQEENIPCELETFIHGAMCVSISGRCFLSYYSSGKSANRGACLQPCRREFSIIDKEKGDEYVLGEDYVLSPKDLCAIDFIDTLIEAGIHAFKIEGRMRPPEYVKVTVSAYRQAIDAFFEQRLTDTLKARLKERVSAVYNRGFSSGFYYGTPAAETMGARLEHRYEKIFLGEVKKFYKKINVADILLQNGSLARGSEVLFVGKHTPALCSTVDQLQQNHCFVERAEKGARVGVKLPFAVKPKDKVFIWRKKEE